MSPINKIPFDATETDQTLNTRRIFIERVRLLPACYDLHGELRLICTAEIHTFFLRDFFLSSTNKLYVLRIQTSTAPKVHNFHTFRSFTASKHTQFFFATILLYRNDGTTFFTHNGRNFFALRDNSVSLFLIFFLEGPITHPKESSRFSHGSSEAFSILQQGPVVGQVVDSVTRTREREKDEML